MIINKDTKIVQWFFAVVVMLLSGHAAQTIFSWTGILLYAVGVISIAMLILMKKDGKVDWATVLFITMGAMIFCTFAAQLFGGFGFYFRMFCCVSTAFFIVRFYPFEDAVGAYRHIMTVTTVIAIIGFIILHNTNILDVLPSYNNVNDKQFGFSMLYSYLVTHTERNCGMFWEPGLLATHLTFAMIVELLFVEKTDWKRIVLYIVGFITASSSAGYVLVFLCLLLMIIRGDKKESSALRFLFKCVTIIVAVIVILNFDNILSMTALGENEYFLKLSSDSLNNSSRSMALAHNFKVFAMEPIFGVGIARANELMDHVADTSTSTFLLSVFGLLGAVYTIAWVCGVFFIKNLNVMSKVVLVVVVLVILNKEPHHMLILTWVVLFYLIGGKAKCCTCQRKSGRDLFTKREECNEY